MCNQVMNEMGRLYRGVSKSLDESLGGKLLPKGYKAKTQTTYGGRFRYGQVTYSESETNAVRAHHIESGMFDGCYVSTTRSLEAAKRFATHKNTKDGYVYVIDESLLIEHGVVATEFQNPEYPHELEVTLRAKNCKEIPPEVVVDKIEIKCT